MKNIKKVSLQFKLLRKMKMNLYKKNLNRKEPKFSLKSDEKCSKEPEEEEKKENLDKNLQKNLRIN